MKQRFVRLVRVWMCAAMAALLGTSALATTVLPPDFDTMVSRADLIFSGRMVDQRCEWRDIGGQKSIVTLVRFAVDALHKGNAKGDVVLQFLGGKIGDVSLEVTEMPQFRAGERVVLFVANNGTAASPLVGFYHGKFRLEPDGSGKEAVYDSVGSVADVKEIGKPRARSAVLRPMSHDEFAGAIKGSMAKGK